MDKNISKLLVAPPPSRFTATQWDLTNRSRTRFVKDQQQLADRIIAASDLLLEHTDYQLKSNKEDTNFGLKEKLAVYDYKISESAKLRRKILEEIEAIELAKQRIMNAIAYIEKEALYVCTRCIAMREGRIGIDLAFDQVEKELLKEKDVIEGALNVLNRLLTQGCEQMRILRSTIYLLDHDLKDKEESRKIDEYNLTLHEKCLNLSIYHGKSLLANADISEEQWQHVSNEIYEQGANKIINSVQLRLYMDQILLQIIEDLTGQYNITNEAFRRRIEETKESKTKLELHHYETVRQVNEMTRNITRLEKTLAEKEGFVALTHTRLGNRAQRPNMELCRDTVEIKLLYELEGFANNVNEIQLLLSESHASLRYMKKTQLQIEEDINVKTNSLKIDEVDCMTFRQKIDYHNY